ncbi:hypothetical protein DFH07DRAFT_785624 [Mycena maculata]|uniref:Uncharacterized protein n=1 Tax=Mycena maculata TaxID=230809 RepID=A0AAD7MFJ2_9AGAR|nr:hypothetical protein DFH07DRAFT_785624 [Mycena maculata]
MAFKERTADWIARNFTNFPPPMVDGDDMSLPWQDDEHWIEDRFDRGALHERKTSGYWTGDERAPTWVWPLGGSLNTPPPPFRGFRENRGNLAPKPEKSGQGMALAPPAPPAAANAHAGRPLDARPIDTRSIASSDAPDSRRYYEPREYRDDLARQQQFSARERFRDEAYWGHRGPRYDPRNARPEYSDRDALDRKRLFERDRDRYYDADREDQTRARETRQLRGLERLFPSPDVREARCGPDGHPIAHVTELLDADTHMDGASMTAAAPDPDYVTREEERIARSRVRASRDPNAPEPVTRARDARLGVWRNLQIATIDQAMNLSDWLDKGEESSFEFFQFIVQNAAALPLEFRSEGESYIMRHQQALERGWWVTTTGAPRPSHAERLRGANSGSRGGITAAGPAHRRINDDPLSRSGNTGPSHRHVEDAPPIGSHQSGRVYGPSGPSQPASWSAGPIAPVPSQGAAANARGYLGSAPPNPDDIAPGDAAVGDFRVWHGFPNSLATAVEVARHFSFTPPLMWTTGMRNMLGERPRPAGDTAHVEDALAYATCVALGPSDRRALDHQWRRWYETVTLMLSIPGYYAHLVVAGGYPPASLPLQHYPYLTDNFTMPLAAAWLICHGIPVSGPAITALESFARSRRNVRNNIVDLNNVGWSDTPHSLAAALEDSTPIPAWAELQHAPLRPGSHEVPGAGPPRPAFDGLAASMHAQMDVIRETSADVPSTTIGISGTLLINDPVGAANDLPEPPPDTPEAQGPASA